jgi:proteasome lid subunit RPN8/RPN11
MFYENFPPYQPELPADQRSTDREIGDLKPVQRKHRRAESTPRETARPIGEEHRDEDESLSLWMMKITQAALRQLMEYLLSREPELAGLLLGPADDDSLITHFVPDRTGHGTSASFELGTVELNDVLKRMKPAGINCKGIAHSHPAGITSPSHGDLIYLRRTFDLPTNAAAAQFYMPIVCGGRLYPYVYAQGRVWRADLVLI